MLRTIIKQCDGMTLAVMFSVLGISVFAISVIQHVFVHKLLKDDAHSLSITAAEQFSQNILATGHHKPSELANSLIAAGMIADSTQRLKTRSLTAKKPEKFDPTKMPVYSPKPIHNVPHLQAILKSKLDDQGYLNELRTYAIYLPSGEAYMSERLYSRQIDHQIYLNSYPVISSVQRVFIKGQPLHALHEAPNSSYERHFFPVKKGSDVLAVVLLETSKTIAGMKVAKAISNAVWLTLLAVLPIIGLMIYLVWTRLQENLKAEQKINYLSQHDEMTGLPNRSRFYQTLNQQLERNGNEENNFALLLIDIDDFHTINDLVGHSRADDILLTVAERLMKFKPQTATLARLSADEFAMILPGISLAEEAAYFADQFLEHLKMPLDVDGDELSVSTSIGIAFSHEETNSAETMMKNSKLALYLAKQEGGTFRFFEPSMDMALQKRRKLEMNLAQAINQDQFEIYYQPQVELNSRKVIGYEALLRWQNPEFGLVSPADFIPVLEETKMIVEVGEYVLKRACLEAINWAGGEKLAVNMSPVQFEQQNVPEMVERVLEETGFPAERLEIEITESILMSDTDRAVKFLFALKKIGVEIALDDFGTGYSSLSYISKFEFDKIKIDRSFVSALHNDVRAKAIINSVISLGRALNVMVTAEGIETDVQLMHIQSAGCHFGQGYLFGKPEPLSELDIAKKSRLQVA